MKPLELDVQPNAWDNRPSTQPNSILLGIKNFLIKTLVIAELEVRKLRHNPSDLLLRAVQPALWLVIFGQVFSRTRAIPTGDIAYLDFMTPGILAQSGLFMAIFTGGMTLIWERDLGVVHKFLAAPIPRAAIVLGKSLACGVRCCSQVIVIYLLALLLGVNLNHSLVSLLQVILVVFLGAGCFCAFSLIIGCLVRSRERFTGIGQLITMPLFFASNAIYPISLMPDWLKIISHLNPLTYQVDALRGIMVVNGTTNYGLELDCAVLLLTLIGLTFICGRLYPRVVM